jgi:hypothetical protein
MYNIFCSSIDREYSMWLQRCFPAKQEDVQYHLRATWDCCKSISAKFTDCQRHWQSSELPYPSTNCAGLCECMVSARTLVWWGSMWFLTHYPIYESFSGRGNACRWHIIVVPQFGRMQQNSFTWKVGKHIYIVMVLAHKERPAVLDKHPVGDIFSMILWG